MKEIENLIMNTRLTTTELRRNYHISLLTNTRSRTREINNAVINYSTNNEFFNDQEFGEVLRGIQEANFYVEPFFNELEFIQTILKEAYYKNKRFVYNLSRNGTHIGKKSLIPSFCDLMSIPYTGSNALIISVSRAKYIYTKYLENHNVKVPKSWVYDPINGWLGQNKPIPNTKILIKPMHESASIGLSKTSIMIFDQHAESEIMKQCEEDTLPILVQEFISGFECEVPVLISQKPYAMNPVGISISNENNLGEDILTYTNSYNDDYNFYLLEREFPDSIIQTIQHAAIQVASLIGLKAYGRIDFRINNQGIPYLMDIAATPYTTKHSSFAFAFGNMGLEYHDIYNTIIGLSGNR
ncbi:ATP-grasp domain-containing protein [Paenibacillus sp. USHLN196]|uniref:ATP-grasp domain-containing protein n=1 Tax=Paenibacillus sp. USHLN196 TaxID=3081291 RepID=UPI00301A91FC